MEREPMYAVMTVSYDEEMGLDSSITIRPDMEGAIRTARKEAQRYIDLATIDNYGIVSVTDELEKYQNYRVITKRSNFEVWIRAVDIDYMD